MLHDRINQAINWLFGVGDITESYVENGTKDVRCTIKVETGEVAQKQYLGTHAAILMRPMRPTSAGSMAALVMRWGDARKPFMTEEPRWKVDVEEGEVVVRAFGDNASRIRLKPNGDVVIEATGQVLHGSGTADKALALAQRCNEELGRLWGLLKGESVPPWVPVPNDGGLALQEAAGIVSELVEDVSSSRVKADS